MVPNTDIINNGEGSAGEHRGERKPANKSMLGEMEGMEIRGYIF